MLSVLRIYFSSQFKFSYNHAKETLKNAMAIRRFYKTISCMGLTLLTLGCSTNSSRNLTDSHKDSSSITSANESTTNPQDGTNSSTTPRARSRGTVSPQPGTQNRIPNSGSNSSEDNPSISQSQDDSNNNSPSTTSSIVNSRMARFTCIARLIKLNDQVPPRSQAVLLRVTITKGTTSNIWYEFAVDSTIQRGILRITDPELTEMKVLLPIGESTKVGIFGSSEYFRESKACESSLS